MPCAPTRTPLPNPCHKRCAGDQMSQMKQQHQKQKKRPAPAEPAGKRAAAKPSHKTDAPKAAPKLLTKREQKEVVKSKKLKFKKNYATIQETVLLWEKLRPKQSTDEEKAQLVSSILKKLQGNIPELANHHSASRVIQWCLKVGSPADKARLTGEVRTNIVALSKSKYGRHVVQKLINVAAKDEVPGLAKLFKGHVAELLRHPSGADVLDDLYSVCPTPCRNMLCCELYGREFTLFDGVGTHSDGISHLSDLLAGVDASKRQAVLRHLYKGLAPVLEKALLHPVMTHRLLRELLTEAPGSVVADVVDTLAATGGNALKLVHTHDGAAAAAMALAYGSPKDRKRLVKGMKGYVWQTADNEWGHAVVATALSVVDDTALTSKTVLSELKGHLEELCTSPHAHRVLMQLLAPDSRRYLPPATYEMLHPPQKTMLVAAGSTAAGGGPAGVGGALDDDDEVLDEEQLQLDEGDAEDEEAGAEDEEAATEDEEMQDADEGEEDEEAAAAAADQPKEMVQRVLGESKKAPDVRRTELLGSGPGSLSAALLALCAEQAGELLRSPVGGDVMVEVARGAAGGLLWQLDQPGVAAVHAAVVQLVAQDCSRVQGAAAAAGAQDQQQQQRKKGSKAAKAQQQQQHEAGDGQQQEPLLTHYFGSRALRRLLLAGEQAGPDGAGARALAESLWSQALQGHCQQLLGSHAEKVLAGLLHCGVASVVQAATAELQPLLGGVEVAAWAAKFMGPGSVGGGKAAGKRKHKGAAAAAGGGVGAGEQQQQQPSQQKGRQKQKRSAAAAEAGAGGEGEEQQRQQQPAAAAAAKRKKKAMS